MFDDLPDAEYYPNLIGIGFKDSLGGTENTPNKIAIYGNKFSWNDEKDRWFPGSNGDFTFSGPASVWVRFSQKDSQESVFVGYNNVQFTGGNALIDYASGFTLPQTDGLFKLTDIPSEYHGKKYAILTGSFGELPNFTLLYGLKGMASTGVFKGFPITGDTAEIPVLKLDTNTMQFSSYDNIGTDTVTGLTLIIQDNENFDFLEYSNTIRGWDGNLENYLLPALYYISGIPFTNGEGTASFEAGKQ